VIKNKPAEQTMTDEITKLAWRLRAADVRFDIPIMPVAFRASCTIEVPVRLKSLATRARAVAGVHLPQEPIVSWRFAEQLTAWLGHLGVPLIAGRMFADLRGCADGSCTNAATATVP